MAKRGRFRAKAPSWLRRNAPMWAAGFATLVCALTYLGHRAGVTRIESLDSWELATLDARFRLRGPREPRSDSIVIVGLDDQTREKRPDLLQTRRGWAELIDGLASYEPELIALDIFFQNPEINLSASVVEQAREAREALASDPDKTPAAQAALAALAAVIAETDGDAVFARSVAEAKNVLLAVVFGFEGDTDEVREPPALRSARYGEAVRIDAPPSVRPPRAAWVASTLESIATGQRAAGFVNALPDSDGHVRRMPLVVELGARYYQPLALSVVSEHLRAHASYLTGDDTVRIGELELPVDPRGKALLSFLGPSGGKTFKHIPAHEVAARTVPREALAGKLVFVGYTDAARDVVATPFDRAFDGVELHATLAHNILHRELLEKTGLWSTLLTILLFGAIITALLHRRVRQRRAWIGAAAGGLILVGYLIASHILFAGGVVVDVVAPMGSVVLVILAALSATLATEGREKAHLRTAFSQYVQGTLVDRILADPTRIRLGGVRRELTVLFSDIRGFSKFSETLEPERLSSFLNEYLTPMTELVMDAGGMLDKYIGDAIMAVYGAPLALPDHAERACDSALRMAAALEPLNRDWAERGLPVIHIGVGINTGAMSVGNMGSEARFDYTVVGDAVNLGARLEALTKEVGATVLCGESTAEAARETYVFRELGSVRIQGREKPARVFELLSLVGESPFSVEELDRYAEAVEAFRMREWGRAEELVTEFLASHENDGPARHLLAEIASHQADPPGDEWDGAFNQRAK